MRDGPERRATTLRKDSNVKRALETILTLAAFAAIGVILAWRG